jgi:hypothetical protein
MSTPLKLVKKPDVQFWHPRLVDRLALRVRHIQKTKSPQQAIAWGAKFLPPALQEQVARRLQVYSSYTSPGTNK